MQGKTTQSWKPRFPDLQGFMVLISILTRTTCRHNRNSPHTICRKAIIRSHKIWTARSITTSWLHQYTKITSMHACVSWSKRKPSDLSQHWFISLKERCYWRRMPGLHTCYELVLFLKINRLQSNQKVKFLSSICHISISKYVCQLTMKYYHASMFDW